MKKNYLGDLMAGTCALALVLTAQLVSAKSFVTEATQVVDGVTEQSLQANGAIESFYRDFSSYASNMVDLEARVEQWQQQGFFNN